MDILIMIVLMALAIAIYRGARAGIVVTLWVIGLVAMLVLFRYHVTSPLDLSF
ncbi:MAG: DUF5993 family protein [Actinomycetes bacterium]